MEPKLLTDEEWREYTWFPPEGGNATYKIPKPQRLYFRPGGTTHRVVDSAGVVHCVPAVGHFGCVLRWKVRDGLPEVAF